MPISESQKPKIGIIVPVHNGGESFRKCLESLAQWHSSAEVVVVADGESDGSWKLAEDKGFRAIVLPECGGPARARNVGARAVSADVLLFIDADVEIHPTTVARTVCAFKQHPDMAALIGSYDDAPGETNFLSQYKNLFHHYTHQDGREEASTFWGACGAIRKDVFLEMGGFNEGYRAPCVEDIELGYRLRQAGHQIRLCKYIQVKHLKRWTPFSLLRAEIFYRALPWMALLLRTKQTHPEQYKAFTSDLNLKWSSRLSVLLVYGLALGALVAVWWLPALSISGICAVLLLCLNWPVYRFFYRKRGLFFTLKVIPWHWLYFFYSGFAFVVGTLRHQIQQHLLIAKLRKSFGS
ncbi:MAG: glycosyltransferase [Cyanobacteria bacterium J06649_4]